MQKTNKKKVILIVALVVLFLFLVLSIWIIIDTSLLIRNLLERGIIDSFWTIDRAIIVVVVFSIMFLASSIGISITAIKLKKAFINRC